MQSFDPNDLDRATRLYAAVTDANARAVFDWLIDHPDQRAEGPAIASSLGFSDNKLVARGTYAIGLAAAAEDRARPWHEAQMGYLMTGEQAHLFRQARSRD
jgi:Family of unknown function (DUF6416)